MRPSLLLLSVVIALIGSVAIANNEQSQDLPQCGFPAIQPDTSTRIIGGKDAIPYSWPWQVALFTKVVLFWQHFCGGTLIAEQWVLTAAHCFCLPDTETAFCRNTTSPSLVNYKVKLGVFNKDNEEENGEQIVAIKEVYVHPKYNYKTNIYDVALLKLATPVNYTDHVSPICLPKIHKLPAAVPGSITYATGWGKTSFIGTDSATLKQVPLPFVDTTVCAEAYGHFSLPVFDDVMICAGFEGGSQGHVCYGDSGGPLVYQHPKTKRWVQLGITSWGGYCTSYGVFSKISAFVDFIREVACPNATELCGEIEMSTVTPPSATTISQGTTSSPNSSPTHNGIADVSLVVIIALVTVSM